MKCQQICKISRKKTIEVRLFQTVFFWGGAFLKHPVYLSRNLLSK